MCSSYLEIFFSNSTDWCFLNNTLTFGLIKSNWSGLLLIGMVTWNVNRNFTYHWSRYKYIFVVGWRIYRTHHGRDFRMQHLWVLSFMHICLNLLLYWHISNLQCPMLHELTRRNVFIKFNNQYGMHLFFIVMCLSNQRKIYQVFLHKHFSTS